MKLFIIAAVAANRVIGRANQLPWRLPADLKQFKNLTMGHTLLMGRRTYESIGHALPGRKTVVMTRRKDYQAEGILVAHSIDAALQMTSGDDEAWVAGGAEIYRQTLPRADRLYLTLIHAEMEGDTFFPEFDESAWDILSRQDFEPDDKNPYAYSFVVYERKRSE